MNATAHVSASQPRSRYVEAYEAGGDHGPAALARFLPQPTDPDYLWVLGELVRSDLRHLWAAGVPARLAGYIARYPDLLTAPAVVRSLADEETAWRCGEAAATVPTAPGVETPPPAAALTRTPGPSGRVDLFRTMPMGLSDPPRTNVAPGIVTFHAAPPDTASPHEADGGPGRPTGTFPKVGDEFLGFDLLAELGTGAFARVFLAEQVGLARRQVALKVTTRATHEPQRLARLRHTNIVPIYSVHDRPPLQAVCMPFLGRQTLADLIKVYRETGSIPLPSHHHASTAAVAHDSTVVTVPHGPRVPAEEAPPAPAPEPADDPLTGMTHQEFVAWVIARVADGLAHAHDRGILHLDLKPANVLFADDGQPLLLDFNLSYDVRSGGRERHGGTLPYMAPEQIEEFRDGGPPRVDQRTDLYAVGVLFFELLTGRHPFPMPDAPADKKKLDLGRMVADRRAGPPSVRATDPTVSPALDAVIRKLLAPDPAGRYDSARDLLTDLDRHRHNLPLRFAANPSVKERAAKWLRRNPRAPFHALLAAAVLATAGMAAAAYKGAAARSRTEAVGQYGALRAAIATLRVDLVLPDDEATRRAALDAGRQWLAAYRLPDRADWAAWPAVADLPPVERAAVAADLGELAMLMAHAEWADGRTKPAEEAATAVARAREWHRVAAVCFDGRPVPPALLDQRQWLGVKADAAAGLPQTAPESAADLYLRAAERIAQRQRGEAIPLLERLTGTAPDHFAGHYALGVCRQEVGNVPQALERYQVAQALAPTDPRPSFQRGQLLLYLKRATEAEAAFAEAVRRNPAHGPSYKGRALARTRTSPANLRGAADDLAKAREHGVPAIQVHLLRADVYDRLGYTAAASLERAAAADLTPALPMDYVVRGADRLKSDPAAALTDFARAAELRPDYLLAWQNMAHVLAERLGRQEAALDAQEKAVAADPRFAPAQSGLAVLLARLGRRADAHAAAARALLLSDEPSVTYQAACAYALTSKADPADAERAVRLLRQALRDGYRAFDVIEKDPDLDPIRGTDEFRDAVAAAKDLLK